MIIRYIKTGIENNIEIEVFQRHLGHCVKDFEFISGTDEEKELFKEEVEANKSIEEQLLMD